MWEEVLVNDFGILDLDRDSIANMQQLCNVYSKGRGDKVNQEWQDDSHKKKATAPTQVVEAADFFLKDIFAKMEELSANYNNKETLDEEATGESEMGEYAEML
jgi:hypothetical protein